MPARAHVFLYYGPYNSCGVVHHSPNRLEGLRVVLEKHEHKVDMIQMTDRDHVELRVNGETVFQCKQRDLDFGGDGDLDPLCDEALKRVEEAF